MKNNQLDETLINLSILAVDDHQIILKGYELLLNYISADKYNLTLHLATNYADAITVIDNNEIDIAFLDIQLNANKETSYQKDGEDIGLYLRGEFPKVKIIYQSAFGDNLRIASLYKSVKPEGYIVKTELNDTLETAIDTVLGGGKFYSPLVKNTLENIKNSKKIVLNELDRELLHHIANGTKTIDIPELANISLKTVERRKARLKIFFGIESANDLTLINEAKKRGFL